MTAPIATWRFNALSPELELSYFAVPADVMTIDEVSACLPSGAYTTLRTYEGIKALRLEDHLQRLMNTSELAGKPLPLDKLVIRNALRQTVRLYWEDQFELQTNETSDLRLRLTVDLEQQPGMAFVTAQLLAALPPAAYLHGVAVITTPMERLQPEAKLTRFIQRSHFVRQSLPEGVNEALMVSPNRELTEGLSSNFFAVLDGQVRSAGTGVLAGVTRSLVLANIRRLGLPHRLESLCLTDLPLLEEAFLTSSSRGVLPVSQIDQLKVGTGEPGLITLSLMDAFAGSVRVLVEPI